jgi:hypothetical protein
MTVNNSLNAPNAVIQKVSSTVTSKLTCSTELPLDDTIPQKTEGTEVLTLAITPTSSTNILKIEFSGGGTTDANKFGGVALFQDATTNALAAQRISGVVGAATASADSIYLTHVMTSGTTSSTTFKIRMGCSAGSTYINGTSSARVFGGVASTVLTVTEYQA